MKRHFLLLALTGVAACLSACAFPSSVQWVNTARIVHPPGVNGPLYTINSVALQQYSPKLYTPFAYDHRGLDDNAFYHAQAIRHGAPGAGRGSVYVGPLTPLAPLAVHPITNPALGYEVRRATALR